MTYLGTVRNGKVELEQGAELAEGTRVRVEPIADSEEADPAYQLHLEAVDAGIPDLAREHDHYIYGTPKRGGQGKEAHSHEDDQH
jgi:hypothetical protein